MKEKYPFTNTLAGIWAGLTGMMAVSGSSTRSLVSNFAIAASIWAVPRIISKLKKDKAEGGPSNDGLS